MTTFFPFFAAKAKWSRSFFSANRAETPPGTGSLVACFGSLFGSVSTVSGASLSRTGTGHPAAPSDRFGVAYTTGTVGSVGAVTRTGFTPSRPGPLKPTSADLPRWTASGNAVVAPGKRPMRTR